MEPPNLVPSPCQLFAIPDDFAGLNRAYVSPSMRKVRPA